MGLEVYDRLVHGFFLSERVRLSNAEYWYVALIEYFLGEFNDEARETLKQGLTRHSTESLQSTFRVISRNTRRPARCV